MGAPMVPPFRIKIKPVKLEVVWDFVFLVVTCAFLNHTTDEDELLQGEINRSTGEAALEFVADFMFTAGPLYKVLCSFICWLCLQADREASVCV